MANPLFGMLSGQNPMQMLMQLKQNPLGFLQKVGFNIPTNLNNPQQIVEHLTKNGDSEFLEAVEGKPTENVMMIMDELMDSMKVLQPRIYDSVMRKVINL